MRESTTENTGVGGQTIGDDLNGIAENTVVGAEADGQNIEVENVDEEDDNNQSALEHEMDERYRHRQHNINLCPRSRRDYDW